ncbi:hypothetical protein [Chryseobacterium indoltheticum]|uniref:hypothetical protein n=1 Tax=Chryseobacterium indoltheticum TaxID=254 RepID=UPI003F490A30
MYHTILAYITVIKHQRNIESFVSNKESVDLNWIKNIIYIIIGAIILSALYGTFIDPKSLNIYVNICFLAVVYMIAYYSIKQREIYPQKLDITEIVESDNSEIETQKSKDLISATDLEILKEKAASSDGF